MQIVGRILLGAGALLVVVGCSDALDWRRVPLPALALQASLPCKPERTERAVELAGTELMVLMHTCKANAVTFAVACATLKQPERAGVTLNHWRAAVLAAAQTRELRDQAFLPAGALDLPQSLRTAGAGVLPGGAPVRLDGVWFARTQGDAVRACHAIAYGPELTNAVADVFVSGLSIQ